MQRRAFLAALSAVSFTGVMAAAAGVEAAPDEARISGPYVHDNLAIYLVHGTSAEGPVPLTLDEAMAANAVEVRETGNVNRLEVENTGTAEVFIQAGDIVKGGRQDRVLAVSLLLPPRSGKLPISAYCVEQGRWAARGKESVTKFALASDVIPSREAKLAMKAAPAASAAEPNVARADRRTGGEQRQSQNPHGPNAQGQVWAKVGEIQDKLAANLGAKVRAAQSESSLQLALENERLVAAQTAYVDALLPKAAAESDVIGYVFAINGRINSADVYASTALFRKVLPRVLKANATEAIGAKDTPGKTAEPAIAAIAAFLKASAAPAETKAEVLTGLAVGTRDSATALQSETRRADGRLVHRNVLAK